MNKKGKNKAERNLFLRARPSSSSLNVDDAVELRSVLLEALLSSEDPILKTMRDKYEALLDIESHFIKDGELYVGLKNPQVGPSQAVVLRLGKIDDIFAGNVNPTVWHVLNLKTDDGNINRLSDMAWKGDSLLVTSTSDEGMGHLWLAGDGFFQYVAPARRSGKKPSR